MEKVYSVYHFPVLTILAGKWEEEQFKTQEEAEIVAERITNNNPLVISQVVLFEEVEDEKGEKTIISKLVKEFRKVNVK